MDDLPKELTLAAFCGAAIRQNTTANILACNEQTAPYGLTLTPQAGAERRSAGFGEGTPQQVADQGNK